MTKIVVGLLLISALLLIVVFALCYKIPQVLQVLLMRAMLNKVVQRGYVSKVRAFYELVKLRLRFGKRDGSSSDE